MAGTSRRLNRYRYLVIGRALALYDAPFPLFGPRGCFPMKSLCGLLLIVPLLALADGDAYDCDGKTRFIHRGAPSTVPAAAKRSYRLQGGRIDGLACQPEDQVIGCMGLTPEQAMRKIVIDLAALSVSDTMELPTSLLIFEGQCKPAN